MFFIYICDVLRAEFLKVQWLQWPSIFYYINSRHSEILRIKHLAVLTTRRSLVVRSRLCVYTHTRTHTQFFSHTHVFLSHMHARTDGRTDARTHIHTNRLRERRTRTHKRVCVCVCRYCVCVYSSYTPCVCMYVCMYMCVFFVCVCVYIYI